MGPIKKEALSATSRVCFLCQESSDTGRNGSETDIDMILLSGRMPHSKTKISCKIENMLGKSFSILVEKDDVICESCFKILVRIDKMEMVIKSFLSVKYNLGYNDESILVTGDTKDTKDPLEIGEADDEIDTSYVVQADNDSSFGNCSPINIDEEHNYYSLPNLDDPELDEYSNTTECNTKLVKTEPGPTEDEEAFDSLPDSSKIEPIDMTQLELDIANTNNGAFKCAKCRQMFTCVTSLRRHLVLHSGKPEPCRICLKLAPDKIFLKIHVRQVHMKKVDTLRRTNWKKPLVLTCPHCPYQACEVLFLVRHINNMHNKLHDVGRQYRKANKKQSEMNVLNKSNLQMENFNDASELRTEIVQENVEVSKWKPNKGCKIRIVSRLPKSGLTSKSKEVDQCFELTQETRQTEKGTTFEKTGGTSNRKPNDGCKMQLLLPTAQFNPSSEPQEVTWIALFTPETKGQSNPIPPSTPQTSVGGDSKQEMRPCPLCKDKLFDKGNLACHMKGHDPKPVACRVCDVVLEDRVLHKLHMQKMHKKGAAEELAAFRVEGGFRCPECGRVLSKPSNLLAHMRLHRDKLAFRCRACLEVMPDRESLQVHWRTVHLQRTADGLGAKLAVPVGKLRKEDTPCRCPTCDAVLSNVFKLNRHMVKHDGKEAKCSCCGEMLADKLFLRLHRRTAHYELWPMVDGMYTCQVCKTEFTTKGSLRYHMIAHDCWPVKCSHCDETLPNQILLRKHTKAVHFQALVRLLGLDQSFSQTFLSRMQFRTLLSCG